MRTPPIASRGVPSPTATPQLPAPSRHITIPNRKLANRRFLFSPTATRGSILDDRTRRGRGTVPRIR